MQVERKLIICANYQVNRMNGIKSGGGGVRLTPPPPLCLRVTFLRLCLLGLTWFRWQNLNNLFFRGILGLEYLLVLTRRVNKRINLISTP